MRGRSVVEPGGVPAVQWWLVPCRAGGVPATCRARRALAAAAAGVGAAVPLAEVAVRRVTAPCRALADADADAAVSRCT